MGCEDSRSLMPIGETGTAEDALAWYVDGALRGRHTLS